MLTKDHARQWLRPLAIKYVSETATSYTAQSYTDEPNKSEDLGVQVDLQPHTGKVVEVSKDWCLVKTGDATFFVAARHLLDHIPEVGSTVKVTTYARRDFNGRRLDEPATAASEGVPTPILDLIKSISALPIDKSILRCDYLLHMIDQVEKLRSPDGVRRLSQVLIDAGALNGPVAYKDPVRADEHVVSPTLQFRVDTMKFKGALNIVFDRTCDTYIVQLVEPNTAAVVKEIDDVTMDDLAKCVYDLVDDGTWKIAKVEVLKSAPKKRKLSREVTDVTDLRLTA